MCLHITHYIPFYMACVGCALQVHTHLSNTYNLCIRHVLKMESMASNLLATEKCPPNVLEYYQTTCLTKQCFHIKLKWKKIIKKYSVASLLSTSVAWVALRGQALLENQPQSTLVSKKLAVLENQHRAPWLVRIQYNSQTAGS